jgi:hypothetical protein
MDEQPAPPAEAVGTTDVAGSLKLQIERVLDDMESLGIVTELAEKVLLLTDSTDSGCQYRGSDD